jgi:hypothetical protein
MTPLGLLHLSRYFKDHGWRTSLLNCLTRFDPLLPATRKKRYHTGDFYWEEQDPPTNFEIIPRKFKRYGFNAAMVRQRLEQLPPVDCIGVSSLMTYWYPGVEAIVSELREVYPTVPLFLSGIYASLCTDHARNLSGITHVFPKKELSQFHTVLMHYFPDTFKPYISSRSFPDYTLVRHQESLPLRLRSGCSHRCKYCASSYLDPQPTILPQKAALTGLTWGREWNIEDFVFYDDALLYQFDEVLKPFLEEKMNLHPTARFHTPNALHARYITKTVADWLYQTGFETIRVGLETIDPILQAKMGNKADQRDWENAIDGLVTAGFNKSQVGVYVMVGVPGQTLEHVYQTISYLKDFPVLIKPVWYSPIPHTPYFDELKQRFPEIENEPLFQNDTFFPIWSGFMSESEGQKIRSWVRDLNQRGC